MDFSPYMTVPAALKFREDVGGEEAIMSYNHRLALNGSAYLAEAFGTEVLQDVDQIGNIVDVGLPINNPDDPRLASIFRFDNWFDRFPEVYVPAYQLGGKWWIRISVQIYNDFKDFEVLRSVYTTICDEINGNNSTASKFNARSRKETAALW